MFQLAAAGPSGFDPLRLNARSVPMRIAFVLAGTALASSAQDVGQHPAVFSPRQPPGVDVSTFIVGHPASPRWRSVHANGEHPAVQASREAARRSIDPNTFIVQPPARAEWRLPASLAADSVASNRQF